MKFGYFTLTDNSPGYGAQRRDPNQLLLEVADECVEAEAMGYNSAWVPEHHFARFGVLPSPAMFLAHVAARTKRIKLGPATVVLPLNHPLRVVEEFNLLDVLSHGRPGLRRGRVRALRRVVSGQPRRVRRADGIHDGGVAAVAVRVPRHVLLDPGAAHDSPAPGATAAPRGVRGLLLQALDGAGGAAARQLHLRAVRGGHALRLGRERGAREPAHGPRGRV